VVQKKGEGWLPSGPTGTDVWQAPVAFLKGDRIKQKKKIIESYGKTPSRMGGRPDNIHEWKKKKIIWIEKARKRGS